MSVWHPGTIAVIKQLEEKQKEVNDLRSKLEEMLKDTPIGTYAQDDVTGVVYKIVKPKGTFTYYRDVDYVRTAVAGERAGTLSKKEAEEAGFVLNK